MDSLGKGEGGGSQEHRRVICDIPPYHFQNTRRILKHMSFSRNSQHSEALAVKPAIPCCIADVPGVLPTIKFDDKPLDSKDTKSTMYFPTGSCLLNLIPFNCLAFK